MVMKFDADAASIMLRVLRFIPRLDQPAFIRAMLAHATAYLCMLEGDAEAAESLQRLADAVMLPVVREQSAMIREVINGTEGH